MKAFGWANDPDFLAWIRKLGIVPEQTRRIVIDANIGEVLTVYAETYGQRQAFEGEPPQVLLDARLVVDGLVVREAKD